MKFLVILFTISLLIGVSVSSSRATTSATTQYMNRFTWPLRGTNTRDNHWGGGRTIYLDRHRSDCGIGAIAQFKYERRKDSGRKLTRFRYSTMCIMPTNCVNKCPASIKRLDNTLCKWRKTRPNILGNWGGLSTNYLDRHYVKCPANHVLTNFKLVTQNRKVYYHFRCCPAKVLSCGSYNTPLKPYGNLSTASLGQQIVKVKNVRTQAMTGFRLLTNYSRKGCYYHVDYCTVKG